MLTGRYILQPEIFDFLEKCHLGWGEIQLTDAMRLLDEIYGHVFPGRIYDIGTTLEWQKLSGDSSGESEVGEEIGEYLNEIMNKIPFFLQWINFLGIIQLLKPIIQDLFR